MKRFLRNSAIFALVVVVLAIIADVMISKGLRQTERGHFYTMNALMNQKMDADVVILGNSRASTSYHPYILDTVLGVNSRNLGVSAQPFGVSYLRWQLYRRNNEKPKLLIVNIDFRDLREIEKGFEKEQYYPYMRDTLVKPYLDSFGFTWADKHVPMCRYRGNYKLMAIGMGEVLHIHHDRKGDYYKGYSNENAAWDGTNLDEMLRYGVIEGHSDPQVVKQMEKLLQETTRDGIPVVFVYVPLHKKLKDNLDETKTWEAYRDLSQRYDVPILDFSEMEFCSDTSYFMNGHHLNRKGAEIFSLRLAQRLKSMEIINQ